jgi:hypothetical protein
VSAVGAHPGPKTPGGAPWHQASFDPASSRKELIRVIVPGMNQALDNGKNERGRNAEHQHSVHRFKRSQQLPSWWQYNVETEVV